MYFSVTGTETLNGSSSMPSHSLLMALVSVPSTTVSKVMLSSETPMVKFCVPLKTKDNDEYLIQFEFLIQFLVYLSILIIALVKIQYLWFALPCLLFLSTKMLMGVEHSLKSVNP